MSLNSNVSVAALLFLFKCLMYAGADKAVPSSPNMFWFCFSYVQKMGCERLFFLLHAASKLYKVVFDV